MKFHYASFSMNWICMLRPEEVNGNLVRGLHLSEEWYTKLQRMRTFNNYHAQFFLITTPSVTRYLDPENDVFTKLLLKTLTEKIQVV